MKSNYKLLMFALTVLLLFQVYFTYYYLLGEGLLTASPLLGFLSLGLGIVIIFIMISAHRHHKKKQ